MAGFRLGVTCAVIDEQGRILLSQRSDFGSWNLPSGRLDYGEMLQSAAVREVREETGIECEIVRPVGLYFQQGRRRMNVFYEARPIGGELVQHTDETRANGFFAPDDLPDNLFGDFAVRDVYAGGHHLFAIETPAEKLREINRRLAIRWVFNLLRGKPEPPYPDLRVNAALAIWDESQQRVMTVPIEGDQWLLRVPLDGQDAPWEKLRQQIETECQWRDLNIRWTGVVQNPKEDLILFVFETIVPSEYFCSSLQWTYLSDPMLLKIDHEYLQRMKNVQGEIWTIEQS